MNDHFQNHSNDWSRVPRPEALPYRSPYAYWTGPQFQAQPLQVPVAPVYVVDRGLSVGIAYVLWLLLGLLGAHYFYMGKIGVGFLYLLTGGLFGVGWVIDLFTLRGQVERLNRRRY